MIWFLALDFLLGVAGQSPVAPAACPNARGVITKLGLSGRGWKTNCKKTKDGRVLMAAFLPQRGKGPPPGIVLSVSQSGSDKRATARLEVPAREFAEVLSNAEEWMLAVAVERLGPQEFIRVGVFSRWGEDLVTTQELVLFFKDAPEGLVHVWTGLGDREESRFDTCVLSTTRTFSLSGDGKLERVTTTKRQITRQDLDEQLHDQIVKECVAPAGGRDVYPLNAAGR
jgi:hypothetical protein